MSSDETGLLFPHPNRSEADLDGRASGLDVKNEKPFFLAEEKRYPTSRICGPAVRDPATGAEMCPLRPKTPLAADDQPFRRFATPFNNILLRRRRERLVLFLFARP